MASITSVISLFVLLAVSCYSLPVENNLATSTFANEFSTAITIVTNESAVNMHLVSDDESTGLPIIQKIRTLFEHGIDQLTTPLVEDLHENITGIPHTVREVVEDITFGGRTVGEVVEGITFGGRTVGEAVEGVTFGGRTVGEEVEGITGSGRTVGEECEGITGSGRTVGEEYEGITIGGRTVGEVVEGITVSARSADEEVEGITIGGRTVGEVNEGITVSARSADEANKRITVSARSFDEATKRITVSSRSVNGDLFTTVETSTEFNQRAIRPQNVELIKQSAVVILNGTEFESTTVVEPTEVTSSFTNFAQTTGLLPSNDSEVVSTTEELLTTVVPVESERLIKTVAIIPGQITETKIYPNVPIKPVDVAGRVQPLSQGQKQPIIEKKE